MVSIEFRTNSHELFCFVMAEVVAAFPEFDIRNQFELDQCSMACCRWCVYAWPPCKWVVRRFCDFWSTNKVYLFNQIEEIIFRLLEQQLAYCGFFLHRRTHHALIDALNSCAQGAWHTEKKKKRNGKKKNSQWVFPPHITNNEITGLIRNETGRHVLSYSGYSTRTTDGSNQPAYILRS